MNRRGSKAYYHLADALGSVVGLTDETGTKVKLRRQPRGVARATNTEQAPQPYRFVGGHPNPTGFYHLGARYYTLDLGRFTQPAPSRQETNLRLLSATAPVAHPARAPGPVQVVATAPLPHPPAAPAMPPPLIGTPNSSTR
ncbi:RHS repeat-associated core domain-containing protein [Streptomyces sp. NPDC018019]|uniref:RHS repeat-associated core domain-containing protein n=1 Tax=Streptomyces sp. NPDC018019 TaxID=3365030 RepID=UPI0037B53EBC